MRTILFPLVLCQFFYFSPGHTQQKKQTKDIQIPTDSKDVRVIDYDSKSKLLYIADNTTIIQFSISSRTILKKIPTGHSRQVLAMVVDSLRHLVFTGAVDGAIRISDIEKSVSVKSLQYHSSAVTTMAVSANGTYLASGDADGAIIIYDLVNDAVAARLSPETRVITKIAFTPFADILMIATSDGSILHYTPDGRLTSATAKEHKDWIRDFAISGSGDRVVSCGDDQQVVVWSVSGPGKMIMSNRRPAGFSWLTAIDLHADNRSFVVGSINGLILIDIGHAKYRRKIHAPVNDIRFVSGSSGIITLAVATRGNGVLILSAYSFKL